jgi:hypothetical protein
VNLSEAAVLWSGVREAATVELETVAHAAAVVSTTANAWAFAEFVAIRDAFMDEWQPRGGIEAAMIDMLAEAFSLQMYWATIAHERATRKHNEQRKELKRWESDGQKSPGKRRPTRPSRRTSSLTDTTGNFFGCCVSCGI